MSISQDALIVIELFQMRYALHRLALQHPVTVAYELMQAYVFIFTLTAFTVHYSCLITYIIQIILSYIIQNVLYQFYRLLDVFTSANKFLKFPSSKGYEYYHRTYTKIRVRKYSYIRVYQYNLHTVLYTISIKYFINLLLLVATIYSKLDIVYII